MPEFLFEDQTVEFEDGQTILDSLLAAGLSIASGCKAGACQSCLLRAKTNAPASGQKSLDQSTIDAGGFLSCQAKPVENLEVTRFDPSFFPTYKGTVRTKEMLTDDVCQLVLDAPDFAFSPGRFIQLQHSSGIKRPYSIATSALEDKSKVELHIRLLPGGAMSEIIRATEPGDEFDFQGPFGKCAYPNDKSDRPILLIGSGTGLAPLYAILCDALAQGHQAPISLFHGAAQADGLYFQDRLLQHASEFPNFHYAPCCDTDAGEGIVLGSPLEVALTQHSDLDNTLVYLCGHPELVKAGHKKCFLAGASLKEIFADPFEPSAS
ncbi:MAG: 2Fe-2S iron-sulfur cluster binding domain-containing protein [Armatimonadetes bacterium]|nr:2Fe-2S iron-sulfur cluster binding domain-containing protein [Armatimonadota bacterium]